MRSCVQRVSRAAVIVGTESVGKIDSGLLVFLGVSHDDDSEDARYLAEKVVELRVFPDEEGKMNRSLAETGGSMLVVSQFTLFGDCRKGRRPSFIDAASPEKGERLYLEFVEAVRMRGIEVATGRFRAHMEVSLVNDGPVTMLLDSKKVF
ncbi:MAG: D-aminoacyl-tRNA deacylase [Pirellulales bacterium]